MGHTDNKETAPERRLLCGIAFVCYAVTLTSVVALAHSLSALALTAAGQQVTALYYAF